MATLRIEKGPQAGAIFDLAGTETRVGRERGNDVHLMDETASRHHFRVLREGEAFVLEDLDSANGTLVNEMRVTRARLASGDRIRIGATTLAFEEGSGSSKDTVVLGPEKELVTVVRAIGPADADATSLRPGEDPERRASRLSRIVAAEHECLGARDPDEFARRLVASLARSIECDRVYVEIHDEGKALVSRLHPPGTGRRKVSISTGVRDAVTGRKESVLIECRGADDRFADRVSLADAGVSTALAVPFLRGGALFGLVYLDRLGSGRSPFGEEDLRHVTALADGLSPQLAALLDAKSRERALLEKAGGTVVAGMVGTSPAMAKVLEILDKVAPTDSSVLFVGETGTGKELLARALHARSRRSEGPFIAVNCAAIPAELVESEFFGHEKGAFTGAAGAKKGKLTLAEGGTIFLDEVAEVPPHLQTKLLRAIEERSFYPVGGEKEVSSDFRIVAATNRDLGAAIEDGSFRKDLYYRLSVVAVRVPLLRERKGDVRLLAEHFVRRLASTLGRESKRLSEEALRALEAQAWPGNVRELKNAVERAVVLSESDEIGPRDLPGSLAPSAEGGSLESKRILTLREAEELAIRRALEYCGWKKGEAVKILGTTWPTLNKKIQEYGILPPNG